MVADVQSWLDNPASNFGWLVLGDESTIATAKRFDTRESASPPVLTIQYIPGPRVTPTPRPRPTPVPRPSFLTSRVAAVAACSDRLLPDDVAGGSAAASQAHHALQRWAGSATLVSASLGVPRSIGLLEMFFGQLSHPEVLEPPGDHPMVERIVGSEFVGLFFVHIGFFKLA